MPITVTINDHKLSAEPGMIVLDVARAHGIYIPTLCYAPNLAPFGGCRLCVVEIERMAGLPTACTTPVTDGMVVHTETPAVQAQRRETLALLLSEHPYTCLICPTKSDCTEFQGTIRKAAVTTGCQYCPKNGQCEIQRVVEHIGLKDVPYPISYRNLPVEQDDPFFDRDMNLCIVCGRCIRACRDVRHANVLAFVERGDHTIVSTAAGRSLLAAGCQFCGACVDACPTGALFDKRSKWEGVPQRIVQSICPYCSVGCAVNIQVRNGRVLRAVGHDDGPSNEGEVCVRGRFGVVDVVHNTARLKSPLIRRGRRLVHASWDQALDAVAEGLSRYRRHEFAVIGSATATNEELYLLQKLARTVMQSNNVALATSSPTRGVIDMLKTGSAPIASIGKAATILVLGANPYESHPIVGLQIRHALSKGARLITVDPRHTALAQQSALWLQPNLGTDHVLLAGVLKALAQAGKIEPLAMLSRVSLNRVSAATGVPVDMIMTAAAILAENAPLVIICGSGVTQQPASDQAVKAIRILASALGADIVTPVGEGNMVGALDMGMHPGLLPGYRKARRPGRDYGGILDGIGAGEIKALYLAGDVPPLPDFATVPFLVVQGIVQSELMRSAQVVLPAATFAEMDGTMTNLEGRVQRVQQAIDPPGQARPGWKIVTAVAQRLGSAWVYTSAADVLTEIGSAVPAYRGISYEKLGVAGILRRFGPDGRRQPLSFSLNGVRPAPSDDLPLLLIAERNRLCYSGVCLTREITGLAELKEENVIHLARADAARLHVGDGAHVKVTSAYGSAYLVASVGNGVPDGTAFVSVNPVVGSPVFPHWMPSAKTYPIRVEASSE